MGNAIGHINYDAQVQLKKFYSGEEVFWDKKA
jgi:hypothetical protein